MLYLLLQGESFQRAVCSYTSTSPDFAHEGVAGYVEVVLTFEIKDLEVFTKIWYGWYKCEDRTGLYHKMKEGKIC